MFIRKNERNPDYSKVLEECKALLVQINGLNGDAKGYLDFERSYWKTSIQVVEGRELVFERCTFAPSCREPLFLRAF